MTKKGDTSRISAREALADPHAMSIVGACSHKERTAAELAGEFKLSLATIGTYVRKLVDAEYLRIRVETVRGVKKYFFTAARRAIITDDDFDKMTLKERSRVSEQVVLDNFRQTWTALKAGTMDERKESHYTWDEKQLDEQAFIEVMTILNLAYEQFIEIEAAALVRLRNEGERPIPTTITLAGFESPRQQRRQAA